MGSSKSARVKLGSVPVEGQTGTTTNHTCPKPKAKQNTSSYLHSTKHQSKIPKGLIGEKCTSNVTVSGLNCNCLLDTGSQVTTVSTAFYKEHLSEQPIQPFNLLDVEGANGQFVPYLGYVEVNIGFPKDFIDTAPEVSTLALVVPDLRSNSDLPVLIGTNLLDVLYDEHCQNNTRKNTSTVYGYRQILRALELRKRLNTSGEIGLMTLKGKTQQVIPAHEKVAVEGYANVSSANTEKWAVLEQPTTSALPGGIFVDCCLITLPQQHQQKLPVWIRNETDHDITITANCVIAELHAPEQIFENVCLPDKNSATVDCCSATVSPSCQTTKSSLTFDFGQSPLPEEWKSRITEKLNGYAVVFAHHELDFGHATKVKHHIKLKDETPFKQRARPIHPNDYEAVRKHLQLLLEAGVIRESESPYSSPIVVVRKKNGDIRLCVDYRKLNLLTIKDAYALPNLEEAFSALTGSKWFSVMDLKSGYYQIDMEECDKAKTAFVCPLGFWEFNRMPQGITNAPSTFQW